MFVASRSSELRFLPLKGNLLSVEFIRRFCPLKLRAEAVWENEVMVWILLW